MHMSVYKPFFLLSKDAKYNGIMEGRWLDITVEGRRVGEKESEEKICWMGGEGEGRREAFFEGGVSKRENMRGIAYFFLSATQLTQRQSIVRVLGMAKIGHGAVPGNRSSDDTRAATDFLNNIARIQMGQRRDGAEEIGQAETKEQGRRGQVGFPGQGPHQEGEDGPAQEIGADGGHVVLRIVSIGGGDAKGRDQQGGIRDPVETFLKKKVTFLMVRETSSWQEGWM